MSGYGIKRCSDQWWATWIATSLCATIVEYSPNYSQALHWGNLNQAYKRMSECANSVEHMIEEIP